MSAKRYTEEFKSAAVAQVKDRGYSVSEVSKRLGVSVKSMYTWLAEARGGASKTTDDLRTENARLRSELKRVEEERDILKKAAAYFAKTSG
jgi:transposase